MSNTQQAQEPVDEQAAFETWVRNTRGSPWPIALDKSDAGNYMYLPAVEAWQVWQARAALYLTHPAPKQAEPEGYKLVPVEPTREMLYAIQNDCDIMPQRGKRVWATLLAAAPTPPAPDVGKPITESAWQPIETAPFGVQLLVTAEFDGPNDWRIKVGDKDAHGHWIVYGASWKPTHWMPLPTPPEAA